MYVIGTAGHVDHGKSTLIEALTGINPDRLAEEKAREMTIDLGFAWLTLLDEAGQAEEVGVVDVPGHRDFIENMLAGVGGIDLALLVIAADEGVMPQTREHLAILDLLEVPAGVVALSKVDLVNDPEWLELVIMELAETLEGSCLAEAPIVPVSARTGEGLEQLKQTLLATLKATPARLDDGRPRLPIDRVFSLAGFGTVVTGTLLGGKLHLGDSVEVWPGGLKGRVRGLQTHGTKRQAVLPGSRVAVNLTGVNREQIGRGHVLAWPGVVTETVLCDAWYRHLPEAGTPLKHNMEVKLFVGAAEVVARARVLGAKEVPPGSEGWLQLALRQPLALVRGDRFILRRPSPGETLGGGRILDAAPGRRHRRFRPEVVARLQTLNAGTPAEQLLQALARLQPTTEQALFQHAGLPDELAAAAWAELQARQDVVWLGKLVMSRAGSQALLDRLASLLAAYHAAYPLRPGMPREELRSQLGVPASLFAPLVTLAVSQGRASENGALVCQPGFAVRFSPEQQRAVDQLLRTMENAGVNTPSVKEAKATVGDDVYFALVEAGTLCPLNADVVYTQGQYQLYLGQITQFLSQRGRITAAQVRDLLGTSRKYAIAFLEHLDERKITRRVGDERELR